MTNETEREELESVWMYKDTLGQWKPFLTERHRQDTIDSGGWEVRKFFCHAAPVDAAVERDAARIAEIHRAVAAIGIVGVIDSYDVIRRSSALDIIADRVGAALAARQQESGHE
jgi:hypothetical protein